MRSSLAVLALVAAAAVVVAPGRADAQFLPDRGPSSEQQEFASAVLLGPEATILGAFLVGGSVFLVSRECCIDEDLDDDSEKGKAQLEQQNIAVGIGAGVGAAIGTAWAVRSICDHFHPGSTRNLYLGAIAGAAIGTAWAVRSICDHFHPGSTRNLYLGAIAGAGAGVGLLFGGPPEESSSDGALRLVAFLFLPTVAAYGGWHMEPGGFYFAGAGQRAAWEGHVGPVRETRGRHLAAMSLRF